MDILWRYDGYDSWNLNNPDAYHILSETKCGWWIALQNWMLDKKNPTKYAGKRKWVSKTGKKRFAYPTKKEALISYIKRKQRQFEHCSYQADWAKEAKRMALELMERNF